MREVWRTLWLTLVLATGLAVVSEGATDIGAFINSRTGASTLAGTEKFPCTQSTNTTVSCLISQIGTWLTSSSTTWTGSHANIPRQTLTVSSGAFTPPSSFGNYWVTTSAASQTVACPTSIADGDSLNVRIQQGGSAPFSPNITFASPCYSWAGGVQPSWSTAASKVDAAFCLSMSPVDVNGSSFICSPQIGILPPPAYALVQGNAGTPCASATTCPSNALTSLPAQSLLVAVPIYCNNLAACGTAGTSRTVSSVAQTSGTATVGTCALASGASGADGNGVTISAYLCPITVAGTATMTMTLSGAATSLNLPVAVFTGTLLTGTIDDGTSKFADGGSSLTPTVTTTSPTVQPVELLFAAFANQNATSFTAGTGYTSIAASTAALGAFMEWGVSGTALATQSAGVSFTGSVTHSAGIIVPIKNH